MAIKRIKVSNFKSFKKLDLDLGQLAPAAIVHGVADYITERITLGAIKGMPTKSSDSFVRDVLTHMGKTGAKEVGPEVLQSAAEREGAPPRSGPHTAGSRPPPSSAWRSGRADRST